MQFIKEFVKRKENEIISKSNNAIKILDKDWKDFLKHDTYLIYEDKSNFLHLVKNGNKETKVPWYLFWDFKLKSNLKNNFEKLWEYGGRIEIYNQNFVIQKKTEYKDLFKKGYLTLDDNQQTAIITDDKHNLVVARAGSGKTEVLITRIAYLIKRKSDEIKPERILALAFQNKAANEIKERLEQRYKIKALVPKEIYDENDKTPIFTKKEHVTVGTFHSLGYKIIKDVSNLRLYSKCSKQNRYNSYIKELYNKEFSHNKEMKKKIINFMKSFGDKEKPPNKDDKESYYKYLRGLEYTSLNGEPVDSKAEKVIMDFFLSHKLNGEEINIKHAQEAVWMKYTNEKGEETPPKPDFYFPDFDIYLEHWAIDKGGNVPPWFKKSKGKDYVKTMGLKKERFASQDKYHLIETYSWESIQDNFEQILKDRFIKAIQKKFPDKKFEFEPLTYDELTSKSWDSSKFVGRYLPDNIARFIQISKTNNYYPENIKERLTLKRWSSEQIAFASLANDVYTIYQKELDKNDKIDFSDMINKAIKFLKEKPKLYLNTYEHILIDEYQDMSTQRYELINELMKKNPKCKLFCVGDDWQSIMGFTGSNLNYFINFDKYFSHPAITDLTKNYRSTKTIVEAATSIINNNKVKSSSNSNEKGQIPKKTIAVGNPALMYKKDTLLVVSVHESASDKKYNEAIAKDCLQRIKDLHEKDSKRYPFDDFLVLMRIKSEKKYIWKYIDKYSKEFDIPIIKESHKEVPNKVRFMSVHKSKGLQAKVVIVLNMDKGQYGFPCDLEQPDIFEPAIKNSDGMKEHEQEERRLFYVAVSRAKEEVIMYTQKNKESKFITENEKFRKREKLRY